MSNACKAASVKEAHPAALLFPMMPMDELQKLAEDIKANGLLEPIVLLDDRILDGRNRQRACEMAGVAPHFTEAQLDGGSPTVYVASKNLYRRHLTPSERAAIGAEMVPLLREEAHQRQIKGARNGGHERWHPECLPPNSAEGSNHNKLQGECRQIAGNALQVGKTQIQQAIAIKEANPEMFERLKRGEISVNAAYHKVRGAAPATEPAPVRKHQAVRTHGSKREQSRQQSQRKRMIDALSYLRGLCSHLTEEFNIPVLLAALDAEERRVWAAACYEAARQLRDFARQLGGE